MGCGKGRQSAGGGPACGTTLSFAYVAVIGAPDLRIVDMSELATQRSCGWILTC